MSKIAVISWSAGKDSAYALMEVLRKTTHEIVGMISAVTEADHLIRVHGVPESFLDRQSVELGVPCIKVPLPEPCPPEVLEERMGRAYERIRAQGVQAIVSGEVQREETRAKRERLTGAAGLEIDFPLWGRHTAEVARGIIDEGLEAMVVCVDPARLDRSFLGRKFDESFLADLPESVDACGEGGEFHTLVTGGPIFRGPIPVRTGPDEEKDGLLYAHVELDTTAPPPERAPSGWPGDPPGSVG
jgi:uncharacterized protein (TIGR00290 family)